MNLKTLKSLLVGAVLAGLSFCVVSTVHAQTPPSVSVPSETVGQLINAADLLQLMINRGFVPNDLTHNYSEGYLHGLIEYSSQVFGTADHDGQDVPIYDDFPFVSANYNEYEALATQYYFQGAYFQGIGQVAATVAFSYDAGFFLAIADCIAGRYTFTH